MKKQAVNPFLPSYEYIPDGEPYVFGERVYVYGSHDKFNGSQYCENNYVCWSAPIDDLGNWKYEGIIYKKTQDPMCDDVEKRLLFAPDVQVGVDGRYYLYYAFDFLGVIAVAVCDTPAGKYEFYGHIHYADGTLLGSKEEPFQFDPGVLVDDDGRVYLYSGFCPLDGPWEYFGMPKPIIEGGMVIELEKDMITVKKRPKVIFPYVVNGKGTSFEGHEFFEAPSIRKINDKYYFIYSSINGHELCYAISDRPDSGFEYGGTIISNGDIYLDGRSDKEALNYTGNNHGSIVEIKGQWYVFYHRQTNKHQFSRQACAEKIYIDEDGFIKQVEMTSCGLNNEPLVGKGVYEARIACNLMSYKGAKRYEFGDIVESYHPYFTQEGEDRENNPNQYIANITNGAIVGFKYFKIDKANRIFVTIRGKGNGVIKVSNLVNGEVISEILIESAKEWTKFAAPAKFKKGIQGLYFTYYGSGFVDFMSFEIK